MIEEKSDKKNMLIDISVDAMKKGTDYLDRINRQIGKVQPYMWYFKIIFENHLKAKPNTHQEFTEFSLSYGIDQTLIMPQELKFYMALMNLAVYHQTIEGKREQVKMLHRKMIDNVERIMKEEISITELKKLNMRDNHSIAECKKVMSNSIDYIEGYKLLMLEMKSEFPDEYNLYVKEE
jgi:hypothetical protein